MRSLASGSAPTRCGRKAATMAALSAAGPKHSPQPMVPSSQIDLDQAGAAYGRAVERPRERLAELGLEHVRLDVGDAHGDLALALQATRWRTVGVTAHMSAGR